MKERPAVGEVLRPGSRWGFGEVRVLAHAEAGYYVGTVENGRSHSIEFVRDEEESK